MQEQPLCVRYSEKNSENRGEKKRNYYKKHTYTHKLREVFLLKCIGCEFFRGLDKQGMQNGKDADRHAVKAMQGNDPFRGIYLLQVYKAGGQDHLKKNEQGDGNANELAAAQKGFFRAELIEYGEGFKLKGYGPASNQKQKRCKKNDGAEDSPVFF